jgi:hypothetical protein
VKKERVDFKNYLSDVESDDDLTQGMESKLIKITKIKGRAGPLDMLSN